MQLNLCDEHDIVWSGDTYTDCPLCTPEVDDRIVEVVETAAVDTENYVKDILEELACLSADLTNAIKGNFLVPNPGVADYLGEDGIGGHVAEINNICDALKQLSAGLKKDVEDVYKQS